MYYKLQGREVIEITGDEWMGLKDENISVGKTVLPDGVLISTVLRSISLRKNEFELPILFETMVFGGEYDGYTRRYTTYEDAEKGHQQTIEMLFEV